MSVTLCANCKKKFNAARTTAMFCSAKCRVAHNRAKSTLTEAELNKHMAKIEELVDKPGTGVTRRPPTLAVCKNGHPIIPSRARCMAKGCKYSVYAT